MVLFGPFFARFYLGLLPNMFRLTNARVGSAQSIDLGVMRNLNGFLKFGTTRTPKHLVALLTCALCFLAVSGSPAFANNKYASIVVNAYNGKVLYARNADSRRYPASLTKIMTLYLLFEALERGDVSMTTKLVASKAAANVEPTKLGLKPGSTISVEDAIRGMSVKSYNDVAVMVAEKLGGTQSQFAELMTQKAWSMGMKGTKFRNASGLPDKNQYTTARDMATLSLRLYEDFPQYYRYFGLKSFTWKGKTYKSHNKLVRYNADIDGIKTGYIRASGFNVATSMKRSGQRLMAVVMGGKRASSRDAHMRLLLDEQFKRLMKDPGLGLNVAAITKPIQKPTAAQALAAAAGDRTIGVSRQVAAASLSSTDLSIEPRVGSNARPQTDPIGELISAQDIDAPALTTQSIPVDDSQPVALKLARAQAGSQVMLSAKLNDPEAFYGVQIGAYGIKELAVQRLNTAADKAPELLTGVVFAILPVEVESRKIFRARIGPYRENEAEATCALLQKRGLACNTVVQSTWPTS